MSELVGRSSTTPTPSPSLVQSSFSSAAGNNITQTVCYLFPEVIIKHGKSKVISQNTLKTVFKKSRVIKLGLGVNKFILLQLLWQTICQTFLFAIYFAKMGPSFLKTKQKIF